MRFRRMRLFLPSRSPASPPETQLISRLLNGVVITLIVMMLLLLFTSSGPEYALTPPELALYLSEIILWLVIYGINRRGYMYTAWLALAASFSFLNFAIIVLVGDADTIYLTYYFVIPVMLANLFASFRVTAGFYLAHLLLLFAVPFAVPAIRSEDLPVIFYILAGGIILFTQVYRNWIETNRLATEQRYQSLFESIYDPVVVYEDGVYREINPAFEQMFDLRRADLIGQSMLDAAFQMTEPADALLHLTEGTTEMTAHRRDKRTFPVEVHVRSYQQGHQRLQVATLRDLTERRLASQQSEALVLERERVRLMRRFINDVSHDLRTPLAILMTGLYMVKHATTAEQQREKIDMMEAHIQKISKMLEDMLTIVRLEKAAGDTFEFHLGDLNQVVQECYQEQQFIAENKKVQLRFVPDSSLPPLLIDRWELLRALRQLFLNAIKYTPEGGRVESRTFSSEGCAIFEIQDTGIGIPPEKLPGIFELFYRVDEARSIDTGGMGMGLAICQRIIEAHSGKIEVESIPRQGSTFRVLLPLPQTGARATAQPEKQPHLTSSGPS